MGNQSYVQQKMGWNYLLFPNYKRLNRWSLKFISILIQQFMMGLITHQRSSFGTDMYFDTILYVSKRDKED